VYLNVVPWRSLVHLLQNTPQACSAPPVPPMLSCSCHAAAPAPLYGRKRQLFLRLGCFVLLERLSSTLPSVRPQFQFPEDIARIYETRHRVPAAWNENEDERDGPGEDNLSYQDLFMECEKRCKRSGWQRFTSRDPFVRALTGGSALIYQARPCIERLAFIPCQHSVLAVPLSSCNGVLAC
jgi:hypothetical protein